VAAVTAGSLPEAAILSWIVDQNDLIGRLVGAIRSDRIAQAYLFHGPRGVGKTRTAIGFAQALNCEDRSPPCGACLPCRKIAALSHPDVRLLFPATREEVGRPEEIAKRLEDYAGDRYHLLEFARNASIGIDRIRELKAEAAMSHSEGRRRVYILAEAHRMLEDAAQSALKLIEEPPPGTHLVLTVEEPAALLPTIVSRCQQVRFRPLRRETIEEVLTSKAGMGPEEARLVAALSDGSLGRALGLVGEEPIVGIRDAAVEFSRVGSDPRQIREKVREWARNLDPNTVRRNVELLLMWCHDLLAVKYNLPTGAIANIDRLAELKRQAGHLDLKQVREKINALEEWLESSNRNVHPALALYQALHRVAAAPTTAPPPTKSSTRRPRKS
jgi:DNA polymerase-3 subunit delta'